MSTASRSRSVRVASQGDHTIQARQTSGGRHDGTDVRLIAVLGITDVEWRALTSIDLPAPASKDGYVNLLFTVRAIGANPRRRSSSQR